MVLGTYEKAWCAVAAAHDTVGLRFGAPSPGSRPYNSLSLEVGFKHFPAIGARRDQAHHQRAVHLLAPTAIRLVGPVQGSARILVRLRRHGGLQPGRRRRARALAVDGQRRSGLRRVGHGRLRRYGEWATRRYTNEKVRENYSRRFSIRFPNEELPAARPQADDRAVRRAPSPRAPSWATAGDSRPRLWFAPPGGRAARRRLVPPLERLSRTSRPECRGCARGRRRHGRSRISRNTRFQDRGLKSSCRA